jgi:hypothetical protein
MVDKNQSTTHMADPLMSGTQAQEYTRGVLKASTLRWWRCKGKHPAELPMVPIGKRVYYRKSDIDRYLGQ